MLNAGFQDLVSPQGAGHQLSAVLASSNPVVRMRAIALVIGLGAQSEKSVKALQQSGQCRFLRFQPMLHQTAESHSAQRTVIMAAACASMCYRTLQAKDYQRGVGTQVVCHRLSLKFASACTGLTNCSQFAHSLRNLSHIPEVHLSSVPHVFV